MADKFIEKIGEIALGYAWLENIVTKFIYQECETEKVSVFITSMTFGNKCQRLIDILKLADKKDDELIKWLGNCYNIAAHRNAVIHSRHKVLSDDSWIRIRGDKEEKITIVKLTEIRDKVVSLYDIGEEYLKKRAAVKSS
jgi:arginine/lysine/ornithine decarboxylase